MTHVAPAPGGYDESEMYEALDRGCAAVGLDPANADCSAGKQPYFGVPSELAPSAGGADPLLPNSDAVTSGPLMPRRLEDAPQAGYS